MENTAKLDTLVSGMAQHIHDLARQDRIAKSDVYSSVWDDSC